MTKAANMVKRRRLKKGGRPRKQDAIRTPSGAISRGKEEQDRVTAAMAAENRSVALEARVRHHGREVTREENVIRITNPKGVSLDMLQSQLAGYEIGRLHLRWQKDPKDQYSINQEQFDAAEHFADDMSRYYGLTGIPFPSPRAMNMFAVGGYQGDETESKQEAIKKASDKYMALHGVLKSTPNGPRLFTVVNSVCVLDDSTENWPDRQFSMLRAGLNHLHKFYQGVKK